MSCCQTGKRLDQSVKFTTLLQGSPMSFPTQGVLNGTALSICINMIQIDVIVT